MSNPFYVNFSVTFINIFIIPFISLFIYLYVLKAGDTSPLSGKGLLLYGIFLVLNIPLSKVFATFFIMITDYPLNMTSGVYSIIATVSAALLPFFIHLFFSYIKIKMEIFPHEKK